MFVRLMKPNQIGKGFGKQSKVAKTGKSFECIPLVTYLRMLELQMYLDQESISGFCGFSCDCIL